MYQSTIKYQQIFGYIDYFSLYYANRKSKTGEVSLKSVQNILIQNKIQDKRYFSRFRVLVDIVNKKFKLYLLSNKVYLELRILNQIFVWIRIWYLVFLFC